MSVPVGRMRDCWRGPLKSAHLDESQSEALGFHSLDASKSFSYVSWTNLFTASMSTAVTAISSRSFFSYPASTPGCLAILA